MAVERRYVIQGRGEGEAERIDFMLRTMPRNKAYRYACEKLGGDPEGRIHEDFRTRYLEYRRGWRGYPSHAITHKLHDAYFRSTGHPPQCVDIEIAAVCDLACPFCYRQWIATPDKIMGDELFFRLINQCADLGVPSVKLNWRGESLLHPRLPEFIDYAKKAGILEVLINTDAVALSPEKSRAIIEAGLDGLIYSFDGGTKATYERMRVGRFEPNSFETVVGNIRAFDRIRKEMNSPLPRTRIQMILTDDTFPEQDAFFTLFSECVDDVSVKAYTERGGFLQDLGPQDRARVQAYLGAAGTDGSIAHWRDMSGRLHVATGRLACEQLYQRLMVTYDGSVSMCCYDWGNEYPIGYVDALAIENGYKHHDAVMEKARVGARGFEAMKSLEMPRRYVDPPKVAKTLREIWDGATLNAVRQAHVEGRVEAIPICRRCPFKETYRWTEVPS